ncbi:MAG: hypothetical protein IJR57_09340 [Ruminococcus sp.]|nr:hypothetical protein [Ruminococcus sp.]
MMRSVYTPHNADKIYNSKSVDVNRQNEIRRCNDSYSEYGYDERRAPENRSYVRTNEYIPRREVRERPKKSGSAGVIIATIALTLVAAISIGAIIFFATKTENHLTAAPMTTVSTTAAEANIKADAPQVDNSSNTQAPAAAQSVTTDVAYSVAQRCYGGSNLEKTAEENVVRVNGERVYMDVKRLAPEKTGNALHYNANGKTSYGFDWTYSADNGNFVLACNYNFDRRQYDFSFYGVTPGTAHVTLYYNTDDNVKVPVNLTVIVDNDLNVTQG